MLIVAVGAGAGLRKRPLTNDTRVEGSRRVTHIFELELHALRVAPEIVFRQVCDIDERAARQQMRGHFAQPESNRVENRISLAHSHPQMVPADFHRIANDFAVSRKKQRSHVLRSERSELVERIK